MFIVKIVVKCIIEQDGKVLLMKDTKKTSWKPGKWSLPGGKVESNETYLDAAHREVFEETGLTVEIEGLLEIEELIGMIKQDERLGHHYILKARVLSGKLKLPDNHVSELKWFTKDELATLSVNDLTEYYYPLLFKKYWTNSQLLDLSVINVLNGASDPIYQKWLNS